MPAEAYVFGNAIGRRVKSVREAWNNAATKGGLTDFQIRDLRHEAGSRFDEAGMPINYVSNMLGHSNLSTTSRYLNINRRGLHLAMEKFEENRGEWNNRQAKSESVAQPLHGRRPPASRCATPHHEAYPPIAVFDAIYWGFGPSVLPTCGSGGTADALASGATFPTSVCN